LLSAVKERLGVDIRPVTAEETEQYGLQSQQGVMITQVEPNGAMAGTGLEAHDIILALAGQPIAGIESLTEVVSALPSHQRVALFALDHRSGSTGYVQVVIR
jgi:serine protease Do